MTDTAAETYPTVGYDEKTREPTTFNLKKGEALPKGYVDHPDKAGQTKAARPNPDRAAVA